MKNCVCFPIVLSILLLSKVVLAQSDISGASGHIRANGFYLGWNSSGTSGPLDIRNDFPDAINFYTNGAATPDATIVGGNVGIGTTSPTELLQVVGGHMCGLLLLYILNNTTSTPLTPYPL